MGTWADCTTEPHAKAWWRVAVDIARATSPRTRDAEEGQGDAQESLLGVLGEKKLDATERPAKLGVVA